MTSSQVSGFVDRSLRLKLLGVVLILLGCAISLIIPTILFTFSRHSSDLTQAGSIASKTMYPLIGLLLSVVVFLISIGIGSFLAKKWARALTLIGAWTLLFIGASSLAMIPFQMTHMQEAMNKVNAGGTMGIFFIVFMILTLSIPYIILPGIFILLYRGEDVRKTCEHRNPSHSWVDGKPLPVLGLALMMVFSAFMFPMFSLPFGVLPVYGVFIKDPLILISFITLISISTGYIAKYLYLLDNRGWNAMLIWTLFFLGSTLYTSFTVDIFEIYNQMGLSNSELSLLKSQGVGGMHNASMGWLTMIMILAVVLYSKKYFSNRKT